MSYEGFLTIVLTALAVMLAGIGLMIGIVAIWGYAEMKKFLKSAAETHVMTAMEKKLAQYPTPDQMVEIVRDKVVTDVTNSVAPASNTKVQKGSTIAPPYPEGEPNASSRETGDPNAGSNNS